MKRKISLFLFILLILLFCSACGRKTEKKTIQSNTEKNIENEKNSKKEKTENSTMKNNAESVSENNQTTAAAVDEFVPDPPVTAENTSLPFVVGAPVVDKQVFDKTDSRVTEALNAYYSAYKDNTPIIGPLYDYNPYSSIEINSWKQLENLMAPQKIKRFTVIDLDNDSLPEIALSIGAYEDNFFILKYYNNHIYVYYLGIREFNSLKTDGTSRWSSSAFEGGIAALSFQGNTIKHIDKASSLEDIDVENFYIDNKQVTKQDIQKAFEYQDNKPDATWYEYTNENIEKYFSI